MRRLRPECPGWIWGWAAGAACAYGLLLAACGLVREEDVFATPTPTPQNALVNGGFEDGLPPWLGLPLPEATEERAHSGARSLRLLTDVASAAGASQAILTAEFPQYLSGFFWVEDWPEDRAEAYIAAVVTVHGDGVPDDRLVFVLGAGARGAPDVPPEEAVFLDRNAPSQGAWTYFAYPLWEAWVAKRGQVPVTWTSVDITLVIVGAGQRTYFDDIYMGPQLGNPNRPPD